MERDLSFRTEEALKVFRSGMNCTQTVLNVFSAETGISTEDSFLLGSCFGGGMRCGEVCGAVTGALMVLGKVGGFSSAEDVGTKQESNERAYCFMHRFSDQFGSVVCKDLLGDDLSDEEGMERLILRGAFEKDCPRFISGAIEITGQMMNKNEAHGGSHENSNSVS